MAFIDKQLTCTDCRKQFVFTADEQRFFATKNFKNDPKRCKVCSARRAGKKRGIVQNQVRCAECGAVTVVPFKPTQGRPVFCRACYNGKMASAGAA